MLPEIRLEGEPVIRSRPGKGHYVAIGRMLYSFDADGMLERAERLTIPSLKMMTTSENQQQQGILSAVKRLGRSKK